MFYRRNRIAGGTFFITVVTNGRRPLLSTGRGRLCLRQALRDAGQRRPFDLPAFVLLPEHFHLLMRLPPGQENYSIRVAGIKRNFTDLFLAAGGQEGSVSQGRQRKGYRGIWQPRFWEHTIRDAKDYKLHWITYIPTRSSTAWLGGPSNGHGRAFTGTCEWENMIRIGAATWSFRTTWNT
jgi:putative transposase